MMMSGSDIFQQRVKSGKVKKEEKKMAQILVRKRKNRALKLVVQAGRVQRKRLEKRKKDKLIQKRIDKKLVAKGEGAAMAVEDSVKHTWLMEILKECHHVSMLTQARHL